ncbi:hypothetical protein [Alteromonas gracilis]|uniref:hypothetical protein n=1 Tax=Alteromonas gracilis TaxID=1479524 RepID=UPI002FE02BEF
MSNKPKQHMGIKSSTRIKHSALCLAVLSIMSCSSVQQDLTPRHLEVIKPAETNDTQHTSANKSDTQSSVTERISRDLPKPPSDNSATSALSYNDIVDVTGDEIAVNIAGLPLPEFVNEMLGRQLGLSFYLDPKLKDKTDLVTLNIEDPLPPKELFNTIHTVLKAYGVSLKTEGDIIKVEYSPSGTSTETPLLISGDTLPSVPATHRPVFYLMDLNVVQAQRAVGWLAQVFEGQNAKFSSDPERNAVWLRGSLDVVKQAAEVVKLVDQPLMRGRHSMRVEPKFIGAKALSKNLTEVLKAQGYFASEGRPGAVSLFTIEETDSIIVFANDEDTLAFVEEWVKNLDQPIKQAEGDNVFYYQVKNTSAEEVADSINELLAGGGATQRTAGGNNGSGNSTPSGGAGGIAAQASRLVVDFNRNALLFYGSNSEWLTMLPTIEKLDQTPLQVLVEVVIAEVTLSDNFEYGVDWAINNVNSNLNGDNPRDSVSIQNGVLNFFPITSSGYTRAVINLLESDTRATILQTPRILVRSGQEATINVGLDIPVVTATQASTEGNSIVQDVSYRKTGTNLSVKPIVYGGGQVDIELNQEVSRSTSGSGSAGNPTIFSRSISTTLSIKDGGSVLVGGLISSSEDTSNNNVPLLGDLPLIGNLFASKSDQSERTELMILIAPYVVKSSDDSSAITDAFKRQLTLHDQ